MPRVRHLCWVTVLGLLAGAPEALAQPAARQLPPRAPVPRTRVEYLAERERRLQSTLGDMDLDPQWLPAVEIVRGRMRQLTDKYDNWPSDVIFDEVEVETLLGELYADVDPVGVYPYFNNSWPSYVVTQVITRVISNWPAEQFPPTARQRLVNGLLEFVAAGGAEVDPPFQAEVAEALDRLAPEDPLAQEVADWLLRDALAWGEGLLLNPGFGEFEDSLVVFCREPRRIATERWGEMAVQYIHEAQIAALLPPEARTPRYNAASSRLNALLGVPVVDARQFLRQLREATESVLVDFGDERLDNDAVSRLLLVYRALLQRRPAIPARVAEYIQERLFWLAARSDRLKEKRHWQSWANVVWELPGPEEKRLSKRFQAWLSKAVEDPTAPEARQKALKRLRPLFCPEKQRERREMKEMEDRLLRERRSAPTSAPAAPAEENAAKP